MSKRIIRIEDKRIYIVPQKRIIEFEFDERKVSLEDIRQNIAFNGRIERRFGLDHDIILYENNYYDSGIHEGEYTDEEETITKDETIESKDNTPYWLKGND